MFFSAAESSVPQHRKTESFKIMFNCLLQKQATINHSFPPKIVQQQATAILPPSTGKYQLAVLAALRKKQ